MIVGDLRYGARRLLRAPLFSSVSVLVLSLGIGVNAAFFGVVNGAIFKPVNVPNQQRLVNITATENGAISTNVGFTARRFERLEERHPRSVRRMFRVGHFQVVLFQGGSASPVMGEGVSGDYFTALGIRPLMGRLLTAADDAAGTGGPVVISARAWRRYFAADPGVVGRAIRLSGEPATIAGVADDGFTGLTAPNLIGADIWVPWSAADSFLPKYRDGALFLVFAELQSGTTLRDADSEMRLLGSGIEPGRDLGLAAVPAMTAVLPTQLAAAQAALGAVLLAVSGLVLLAACANVSGLLLARAVDRRREVAVRVALGASRPQIFRMQLAEAALLTAAAGSVGYGLFVLVSKSASTVATPEFGGLVASVDLTPDLRVFLFALLVACVTVFLAGLAPAARMAETSPLEAWANSGGGSSVTPRTTRARTRLVALQMAVSVMLLVVAVLFVRSASAAGRETLVARDLNVVVGRLDLRMQKIAPPEWPAVADRLLDAAISRGQPLTALSSGVPASSDGAWVTLSEIGAEARLVGRSLTVSPSFFRVIGAPLVNGREFTEQDAAGSPAVAMVNDVAAADLFPNLGAVGRQIRLSSSNGPVVTIVGVVHTSGASEGDRRNRRFVFLPLAQNPIARLVIVQRASAGDASARGLMSVVAAASPELAVFDIKPLSDYLSPTASTFQYGARVLSAAGFLGFVIALVGLYGAVTYAVIARAREFGIMRALGADERHIRWIVLRDALRLLAFGTGPGLLAALVIGLVVGSWLSGVAPYDPVTFATVPGAMAVVSVLACLIPARRACRIDPVQAIRDL
ncbi:MAG TPA: ABC transporter permease [Vicinamibacterales bacterium]|nr:ABC transporter permease [Vicinamibacterales bacterium]